MNTTIFHYIYGDVYGKLSFDNCLFEKNVYLNNSKLHVLSLVDIRFSANVSFQDAFLDNILIEDIVFEKQANFDDIQIKQIDKCNRKTIRVLKQQLQKAENKIDLGFMNLMLTEKILIEFKKDENKFYHRSREPIQLSRDLFILKASEFVSEYGTDWKRALKFTLLTGFIFFSIFTYN